MNPPSANAQGGRLTYAPSPGWFNEEWPTIQDLFASVGPTPLIAGKRGPGSCRLAFHSRGRIEGLPLAPASQRLMLVRAKATAHVQDDRVVG